MNPSNDYFGLISFRIDWFDLLAVQQTLKIYDVNTSCFINKTKRGSYGQKGCKPLA